MIEYAKISQMYDYQKNNVWPFHGYPPTKAFWLTRKVQDLFRILFNKGPIRSPYLKSSRNIPLEVFRGGTRGWEYPWIYERVKDLTPTNSKVLDCGCGKSIFPIKMAEEGYSSYGLDYLEGNSITKSGYGLNRKHINKYSNKVEFIIGGIQDIPVEDDYFDVVTCISVMEHIIIDNKKDPDFHLKCLNEMCRVLKPEGYLICTYDTILNKEVLFANLYGWGEEGWYYKEDIEYLIDHGMELLKGSTIPSRFDILNDSETYYIPPDLFFAYQYGAGFHNDKQYHKLTSIGFILRKK